ncbi:MAG: HzsA-related protein, partial [Planctomycetota bacterium]
WEREDGIWSGWKAGDLRGLAGRYAKSSLRKAEQARRLAAGTTDRSGLAVVRKLYLSSRRYGMLLEKLGKYNLKGLRQAISCLAAEHPESRRHLAKLDALEEQAAKWQGSGGDIDTAALAKWKGDLEGLRREALVTGSPLLKGCDKLVFVRRFTYSSNHYYTDYVNSRFSPGGGLCTLSLKTGEVKELAPSLEDGVFGRFDLSFDAERVVFAWKCDAQQGYRIYEVKVDGTGLRQLTFPEKNEAEIVKLYRVRGHYHHGTDDMHPCYLPDGGIVFISTRCRYGILCDGPDDFSTTILYRIDADGKNMEKLTNSAVSEASPSIMNDGRILYTRWEYVDKGAVSVKCLWAMRPDGTMTSEVFGNDIPFPPSLIHGHAIPGHNNLFVLLGAPHYPQNRVGTVIRIDINKPIRTRQPMTYITPEIDIRGEGGFHHRNNGGWRRGGNGPLYAEPYPLSPEFVLASYNPGQGWRDAKAYALYLVDEFGNRVLIHRDPEMSCWQARPLRPRETPPVITSPRDPETAKRGLATVVMTDVYAGLEGIERGTVKYVRILEQMPRPWASQRRWGGDCYDQQHAVISKDCALGLKVQHGIVPVEKDGSAHFTVQADRNIFFQALDKDYMEVRRMRTYVYFRPGERRSCIGCHEYRREVPPSAKPLMAMLRPPSKPGPQPGEQTGARPLHYPTDVQPVLDKHCVKCHSGAKPKDDLDLTGTMTNLFCRSYENILRRRLVRIVGENHPKTGNVVMTPAKTWGSHASKLIAHLKKGHSKVKLSQADWVKLTTFVDSNSQYYGSYYGRRNLKYKDHPNFRPVPTFAQATSTTAPLPEGER